MTNGTYIRLGIDLLDHPRTLGIGSDGFVVYVGSLIYAQRHLTDGFIPSAAVDSLSPNGWISTRKRTLVSRLVTSGLWERAEGGYRIRNYLTWQRSRSEVERIREQTRERVRRHRGQTDGNA